MENLIATYPTALLALAVLAFILMLQSFVAGGYKNGVMKQNSGSPVEGTMDDLVFRIVRTHMNGVENFSAFFAASLLAMMAGASVKWLTWLVVGTVVLRVIYWVLYYARLGADNGGARSITHVLSLELNLIIGGMAIFALI